MVKMIETYGMVANLVLTNTKTIKGDLQKKLFKQLILDTSEPAAGPSNLTGF